MNLEGSAVIVTGSATGLGAAVAQRLAGNIFWVPQQVTQKMLEAAAELPRVDPEIPFEDRVDLWQANRARLETEFQEFGEARVRYSLFVFGARTIEDFSSKIYSLVERPFSEDSGGWVMFDDELRKIVGLTLP